jgi:hypothetical protein
MAEARDVEGGTAAARHVAGSWGVVVSVSRWMLMGGEQKEEGVEKFRSTKGRCTSSAEVALCC